MCPFKKDIKVREEEEKELEQRQGVKYERPKCKNEEFMHALILFGGRV